uniref:Sensory transduction histidine kinase n=1 Tax=Methanosarcina barkeri (strain Fusaro / DSM 804) TaxID=269797 RepID=Q46BY3_METBF
MCSAADTINLVLNHQVSLVKREGKWERIENSRRKNTTECKQTEKVLGQSEQHIR